MTLAARREDMRTAILAVAASASLAAPALGATVEWRFDAEVTSLSLYAAPGCSFDPTEYECDAGEHRGPQLGDTGTGWVTLDTEADPYRGGFACNTTLDSLPRKPAAIVPEMPGG